MINEYEVNTIAQYVVYGLLRARMMVNADIESAISDLEYTLKDLFALSAASEGISPVENRRSIALVLVAKLVAMRRIDAFRYLDRVKWGNRVEAAVRVVEVELVNADDDINHL